MSKSNHNQIHHRTLWVTRTGVLIALLVVLQWATSAMGQYVTGSCVNAVLAVAALVGGLWSGVSVAVLSPFCAKLFGIGPSCSRSFLPSLWAIWCSCWFCILFAGSRRSSA